MSKGDILSAAEFEAEMNNGGVRTTPTANRLRADRAALLALLESVRDRGPRARAMLRKYGAIFDKWPTRGPSGCWTPENVAALDPETRWQGIAFSLYTMLVQTESQIDAALAELETSGKGAEREH
jgi:hypothetical protein